MMAKDLQATARKANKLTPIECPRQQTSKEQTMDNDNVPAQSNKMQGCKNEKPIIAIRIDSVSRVRVTRAQRR